jgi:hypothetical protein
MRQGGNAMTKTTRRAAGVAVVVAVLGWTSSAAATESNAANSRDSIAATRARVRSASPRVAAVIIEAAAQSKTFRGLVDQIGTTDGIVYVAEGECGHGVGACLLFTVTMAGPNRVLRILVDPSKPDRDLMASIGHELQHAVEVLSNRAVRSYAAMYLLYETTCHKCRSRFETDRAIRAGDAVRRELRKSAVAERRQ